MAEHDSILEATSIVVGAVNETQDATSAILNDPQNEIVPKNIATSTGEKTVKVMLESEQGFCLSKIDNVLLKCEIADGVCTKECREVKIEDFVLGSMINSV